MSKSATIAAEAVEPQALALVITKMQPGVSIEANFEELERGVDARIAIYEGVTVTDEYVPQAKKDRAALNAFIKDIDQVRLHVTREYTAPAVEFGDHVKVLTARIKVVSDAIDVQVKAFETREKVAKRNAVVAHWKDYAGALDEAVSFDTLVWREEWANKSVPITDVFTNVEKVVERIVRELETLEGLGLAHLADARAEYLVTLDMSAAIARSKAVEAQLERERVLEAEKVAAAAYRAEQAARVESTLTDEVERELKSMVDEGIAEIVADTVFTFTFTVRCTSLQREQIVASIHSLGLTGTVRKEA